MKTNTQIRILTFVIAIAVIVLIVKSNQPAVPFKAQLVSSVMYSCDGGRTIGASYYQGASAPSASPDQAPVPGGTAILALSDGRNLSLDQTISADGVRYADADESFVFWSKGNGALVMENNQEKSYTGCIALSAEPAGHDLSQTYSNSTQGFSLRLPSLVASTSAGYPDSYKVDASYRYQALGPGKDIFGTQFVIPSAIATGTNLSGDSYISIERVISPKECSAVLFLPLDISARNPALPFTEGTVVYSVASSTGAAAGNRYEEMVYAIPGTKPCMAVRYFIHYGVFDNYPAGMIREFDKAALSAGFDAIRRTLVLNQ